MNKIQSAARSLSKQKAVRLFGVLLGLLLLAGLTLQLARQHSWTHYPGLDAVSAVAVDGQGQAWAAGYRQGTSRLMLYPGNGRAREVSMPGELTRTAASALMIDSQDRLWVGTENGMVGMRTASEEWTIYTSHPDFSVSEMVMDGQGRVWVRSHRGPGRIDPEKDEKTFTFMNSGLTDNDAVAIATDDTGQLWVLTMKRELKVLQRDDSWRTHATVPNTVRNSIFGSLLTIDKQGQVWLATSNGVGALSPGGGWTEYPLAYSGPPLSMRAILPDAQGRVWVAGALHGLLMFDPQKGWTNYTSRNSGVSGEVSALALDEHGQVWIGSSRDGLSRFVPDEALSPRSLFTIRFAAENIVPLVLLIVALLAMWTMAFARPGAANRETIFDFSIAFAGWFLLNALLWGYVAYSQAQAGGLFLITPLVLVPLPANILLMIILYRWQRWMALGAFSAILVNWIGLILIRPAADPFSIPPFWETLFMIPFFLSG